MTTPQQDLIEVARLILERFDLEALHQNGPPAVFPGAAYRDDLRAALEGIRDAKPAPQTSLRAALVSAIELIEDARRIVDTDRAKNIEVACSVCGKSYPTPTDLVISCGVCGRLVCQDCEERAFFVCEQCGRPFCDVCRGHDVQDEVACIECAKKSD